jgi:hypothetical protein
MSGSIDIDPQAPLGEQAAPVLVCRYYGSTIAYSPLQNVVCDQIQYSEGSEPPLARFHYLLDVIAAADGYPTQFEDLWPIDAYGDGVVQADDRIVVVTWPLAGAPDSIDVLLGRTGSDPQITVLFDGFAQIPQTDVSPTSQTVNFVAVGVAARCFDLPVGGRLQRDSALPSVYSPPIQTDLPTRFNPLISEGATQPNSTTTGNDDNQDTPATAYPVFLDEMLKRTPDPRASWTLSGAVRYLMGVWNDEKWVKNPDFSILDLLLKTRYPKAGTTFDPNDANTYTDKDITIRDYDATNHTWPAAVAHLLGVHGFGFRWTTDTDDSGFPVNGIRIYRLDPGQQQAPKDLLFQPGGSAIAAGKNTVGSLHLSRDLNGLVNAFSVETPPRRVETSIVLAPGFTPAAGDETAANVTQFSSANLADATTIVRDKYRLWIADETGEGHWNQQTSTWSSGDLNLSPLFPDDDNSKKTYVVRTRPGDNHLITRDAKGKRRRAILHMSRDYAGLTPAVWDGTGTWQPIAPGHSWRILEDRLGILVTAEHPNRWTIGQSTSGATHEKSITLDAVTSIANPAAPNTQFFLRLTTVIDDDIMLAAAVPARIASPTTYTRRHRVDARDHFLLETISQTSALCTTPIGQPNAADVIARDDTEKALAHARQLRSAHEMPPLAGSVTIPWLSFAVDVGDRIRQIRGRNVSLRTNTGAEQGEAPTYPRVVSKSWSFSGDQQSTTIQLTDRRGDPAHA